MHAASESARKSEPIRDRSPWRPQINVEQLRLQARSKARCWERLGRTAHTIYCITPLVVFL
jgi:hypothetical protein